MHFLLNPFDCKLHACNMSCVIKTYSTAIAFILTYKIYNTITINRDKMVTPVPMCTWEEYKDSVMLARMSC